MRKNKTPNITSSFFECKLCIVGLVLCLTLFALFFILPPVTIISSIFSTRNETKEKLVGYTYLGGLDEVDGRDYEGYWQKNNIIYYVTTDPYANLESIRELKPQPDLTTFEVYYDLDSSTIKETQFAFDSQNIYFTFRGLSLKPTNFKFIKNEYEGNNLYNYFSINGVTYRINEFCEECLAENVN